MTKEAQQKFQGNMPYPPESKIDDWGLNAEQQVSLPAFAGWSFAMC